MRTQDRSLGELLRQAGKITSRQIQVALAEQKKSREPIGKIFVRLGFVTELDILQVMQGMTVLTFRVERELCGIEAFRTREVLKYVPFQTGPDRPAPWAGQAALRAGTLPVLSLRSVLDLPPLEQSQGSWFIVLEHQSRPFILWVDEVMDVVKIKIEQVEPLHPYLMGKRSEIFNCVGRIKSQIHSILDPDKLVNASFAARALPEVQHVQ